MVGLWAPLSRSWWAHYKFSKWMNDRMNLRLIKHLKLNWYVDNYSKSWDLFTTLDTWVANNVPLLSLHFKCYVKYLKLKPKVLLTDWWDKPYSWSRTSGSERCTDILSLAYWLKALFCQPSSNFCFSSLGRLSFFMLTSLPCSPNKIETLTNQ